MNNSSIPTVDSLHQKKRTKKSISKTDKTTTPITAEVKSVTPKRKKTIKEETQDTETKPKPKPKPKKPKFVEIKTPQEIQPIIENKNMNIENINIIIDSLDNTSIIDIISLNENPDITTMFNNLLAIS
jgi:hypothetical protein